MTLNGLPFAVTRAVRRIACDVSHKGVGAGKPAARKLCKIRWTRSGTNVLLGRPGRQGEGRPPPIA